MKNKYCWNLIRWAQFAKFVPWKEEFTKFVHPSIGTQNPIAVKMILGWWTKCFLQLSFFSVKVVTSKTTLLRNWTLSFVGDFFWILPAKSWWSYVLSLSSNFFERFKRIFWKKRKILKSSILTVFLNPTSKSCRDEIMRISFRVKKINFISQ